MFEAKIKSVQCLSLAGLHRMSYKEWGDAANPNVLVCVHGVTRVGDDFDAMARALAGDYRVICPDIVGRGRSDWLKNPQLYRIPQYVSDIVTLLARVLPEGERQSVDWFGTSMGGLIGLEPGVAAGDSPVRQAWCSNDIGPALGAGGAWQRIGDYIGQDLRFDDLRSRRRLRARRVAASFGPHSEAEWEKLCARRAGARGQRRRLGAPLRSGPGRGPSRPGDAGSGALADQAMRCGRPSTRSRCPTLAGARRGFRPAVARETAAEMTRRGPNAPNWWRSPSVGHAPTFVQRGRRSTIAQEIPVGLNKTRTVLKREHGNPTTACRQAPVRSGDPQRHRVPGGPDRRGHVAPDIAGQTREVLGHVDRLLAEAGSDKTRILSVPDLHRQDMADFAGMNAVWDAWVPWPATRRRAPRWKPEAGQSGRCLVESRDRRRAARRGTHGFDSPDSASAAIGAAGPGPRRRTTARA
jgi:hypothetical protein